jgi:sec-independent protein translocase protein TatB
MFDIAPSEFLLVAFIALVVIGPKDLPKALRVVGYWVGRARAVGRQFRSGFDEMVREAELAEMEKKWKEENERIMREHSTPAIDHAAGAGSGDTALPPPPAPHDDPPPVMVAQPQMIEPPHVVAADKPDATPAGEHRPASTGDENKGEPARSPATIDRASS